MKLTNHLSRVLAATLFGLGCHTAALHAQNIMLHLDAPQGIDAHKGDKTKRIKVE